MLTLFRTDIDDDEATVLSAGLSGHETLRELNLNYNPRITESGWQAIFANLQEPIFRLENLFLRGNSISDANALSDVLNHNTTLQVLNLNRTTFGRNAAWGGLFARLLIKKNCILECLKLGSTNSDDFNLQLLANALAHNGSLKRLALFDNPGVTPAMWTAFLTYLRNPSSALEELDLCSNSLNDDAILRFVDALADNNMLREIDFMCNDAVTDAG